MEEIISGGISLVTSMERKDLKGLKTKEGWAPPAVSPSRIVLKDGHALHMPNGPVVPASETDEDIRPFPAGPVDLEGLKEILKTLSSSSLKISGKFLDDPGEPFLVQEGRQTGFLIAGGMFFLVGGFSFVGGNGEDLLIGAIIGAIGVVVAGLYLYFRNHVKNCLKVYRDHVEIWDSDEYCMRYFPFSWITGISKIKMVKGEGKYSRIAPSLYMNFLGEVNAAPRKKKTSRYPDYDPYRCIMSPLSGKFQEEESLDRIMAMHEERIRSEGKE